MATDVETYLTTLSHRRAADIRRLRDAILALDPEISETVKWNAPSFRYAEQDRCTFRLHPREPFDVVLHTGAVATGTGPDRTLVDDPHGLLTWKGDDRGVITVPESADSDEWLPVVVAVVAQWMLA